MKNAIGSIKALIFGFTAFLILTTTTAIAERPKRTVSERERYTQEAIASIPTQNKDKTLSPYFFVFSNDPDTDCLPLKYTDAKVNIAGVIAEVQVTQVYKNEGTNVLEAIYIFPLSTRAAVYAMKMTVGNRVIKAQIKERQKAREEYEKAKKQGRTASLLEQQRPNVFQMNVANILPEDEIKVEVCYTELIIPKERIYEFIYPTVVGPRYSEGPEHFAPPTKPWVKNPYLHEGEPAPYTFGMDVYIRSGMPISEIACPSHDKVAVEYIDKEIAHIALKAGKDTGTRDFVLQYSLAEKKIATGLLLYPGKQENFFLLMVEPPKRVVSHAIVPREYIFILDVSGSMHGFPLDITKELMQNLLANLRSSDFFNVLLFSGANALLHEKSLSATQANVRAAINFVNQQRGAGGTRLLTALEKALAIPKLEQGISRIIVVATDGYVTVEEEAFELVRKNLGNANLFAFGIGSSVNRFIIEGMARAGHGEPFVLLKPDQAHAQAEKFHNYILAPVMQGIRVKFEDFQAYDIEPQAIPDLFAEKPVIVYGKYKGKPHGTIVVSGRVPEKKITQKVKVKDANISKDNVALRYLWARERLVELADMNKIYKDNARIKEITDLGLCYNLMTEYTSFVAVDTEVRADGTQSTTVRQPLPLPQGVSDYAIGTPPGYGLLGGASPMAKGREAMISLADSERLGSPRSPYQKDIIYLLDKQRKKFQACYDKYVPKNQITPYKLVIKLTIKANGKTTKLCVVEKNENFPQIEKCILEIIKTLRFPKPKTARVTMNYTLILNPTSSYK